MAKRRSPLPFIICIAAAVGVVAVAMMVFDKASTNSREMDRESYYGITAGDQAAVIVNDTILDSKAVVENGTVYIDYPTVWSSLNSGFYWESGSGTMLLTLPEGTRKWSVGDETGSLIERDGIPYISADCVMENSDIDMEVIEDPYRIVARTRWDNLAADIAVTDAAVRNRADKKGEVLTYVKKGGIVVLLENTNLWCKVSTADGFIGYVQRDQLEAAPEGSLSHESDERFRFPHIFMDEKICLGWQYVESPDDRQFQTLTVKTDGMNVISPTWFRFTSTNGDIEVLSSKEYVDQAHAKGIAVWGCLQDVYGSTVNIGNVFATSSNREHVITQLIDAATACGMDGINIDIETIEYNTAAQYLQFLRELSVAAHEKGLILSTDTYVPAFTPYYDRKEQAKFVDYIILMGYDEHTVGSSEAGSVASLPFVEQGIKDALTEVAPEQLVNGIPFYTRGWTSVFGEQRPQSQAFGMNDADAWADAHGISLYWDSAVGQNVGSSEDDYARYSIWMEDERSIEEKMQLIDKYGLAGVACWRLGLERSAIWGIIEKHISQ